MAYTNFVWTFEKRLEYADAVTKIVYSVKAADQGYPKLDLKDYQVKGESGWVITQTPARGTIKGTVKSTQSNKGTLQILYKGIPIGKNEDEIAFNEFDIAISSSGNGADLAEDRMPGGKGAAPSPNEMDPGGIIIATGSSAGKNGGIRSKLTLRGKAKEGNYQLTGSNPSGFALYDAAEGGNAIALPQTLSATELGSKTYYVGRVGNSPASSTLTLTYQLPLKKSAAVHKLEDKVKVGLLLVKVVCDDTLRQDDDDLTVVLEDWPQSGTSQRSPKFIFAENDNIYVKALGPNGFGNKKFKVKVSSETDTKGEAFDLAEITPGIYANKSPDKPLRLGRRTETQSDCVRIKVVDEEVLTFNLIFDGTDTGKFIDVMVDRGEFASGGIHEFYGVATGDQSVVQFQAITQTKFFNAGNTDYSTDAVAQSQKTSFESFIKNVGSNDADNGEADFLHISAHGADDGKIYDGQRPLNQLLFDPTSAAGAWNTDAEWVMLATCSQLNGVGGGRAAWEPALNGSPRKAHAILGAYKPLAGDLQNRLSAFWTDIRINRELILDAYSDAMGSGERPQPWAILVNAGNIQDKLKEVTRDTSGTVSFVYLDVDTVCGRAGSLGDKSVTQVIDCGNGLVRTDFPSVAGRRMRKAFKLSPSSDLSKSKKLAFAKKTTAFSDGRHSFVGCKTSDILSEKSMLTKVQAGEIAQNYLDEHFPEFASRLQLKEVGQKIKSDWLLYSGETSQINGYLVRFFVMNDDVPVWDNYVNVSIHGNQVDGVDFRVYQHTGQFKTAISEENSVQPLDVRAGLAKSLTRLKKQLTIKGKYEILIAELCYVNEAVASGKKTDLNCDFIPAWHLVVNSEYNGEKSVRNLFDVWMDASTGEIISKKPY